MSTSSPSVSRMSLQDKVQKARKARQWARNPSSGTTDNSSVATDDTTPSTMNSTTVTDNISNNSNNNSTGRSPAMERAIAMKKRSTPPAISAQLKPTTNIPANKNAPPRSPSPGRNSNQGQGLSLIERRQRVLERRGASPARHRTDSPVTTPVNGNGNTSTSNGAATSRRAWSRSPVTTNTAGRAYPNITTTPQNSQLDAAERFINKQSTFKHSPTWTASKKTNDVPAPASVPAAHSRTNPSWMEKAKKRQSSVSPMTVPVAKTNDFKPRPPSWVGKSQTRQSTSPVTVTASASATETEDAPAPVPVPTASSEPRHSIKNRSKLFEKVEQKRIHNSHSANKSRQFPATSPAFSYSSSNPSVVSSHPPLSGVSPKPTTVSISTPTQSSHTNHGRSKNRPSWAKEPSPVKQEENDHAREPPGYKQTPVFSDRRIAPKKHASSWANDQSSEQQEEHERVEEPAEEKQVPISRAPPKNDKPSWIKDHNNDATREPIATKNAMPSRTITPSSNRPPWVKKNDHMHSTGTSKAHRPIGKMPSEKAASSSNIIAAWKRRMPLSSASSSSTPVSEIAKQNKPMSQEEQNQQDAIFVGKQQSQSQSWLTENKFPSKPSVALAIAKVRAVLASSTNEELDLPEENLTAPRSPESLNDPRLSSPRGNTTEVPDHTPYTIRAFSPTKNEEKDDKEIEERGLLEPPKALRPKQFGNTWHPTVEKNTGETETNMEVLNENNDETKESNDIAEESAHGSVSDTPSKSIFQMAADSGLIVDYGQLMAQGMAIEPSETTFESFDEVSQVSSGSLATPANLPRDIQNLMDNGKLVTSSPAVDRKVFQFDDSDMEEAFELHLQQGQRQQSAAAVSPRIENLRSRVEMGEYNGSPQKMIQTSSSQPVPRLNPSPKDTYANSDPSRPRMSASKRQHRLSPRKNSQSIPPVSSTGALFGSSDIIVPDQSYDDSFPPPPPIDSPPTVAVLKQLEQEQREREGSSPLVFGDPETFGSAAGASDVVESPPVADRAKAIIEWGSSGYGGNKGSIRLPTGSFPSADNDTIAQDHNVIQSEEQLVSTYYDADEALGAFPRIKKEQDNSGEPIVSFEPVSSRKTQTPRGGSILRRNTSSNKSRGRRIRFSDPPVPVNLDGSTAAVNSKAWENTDGKNNDAYDSVDNYYNSISPSSSTLRQQPQSRAAQTPAEGDTKKALEYWATSEDSQNFEETDEWMDQDPGDLVLDMDDVSDYHEDSPSPKLIEDSSGGVSNSNSNGTGIGTNMYASANRTAIVPRTPTEYGEYDGPTAQTPNLVASPVAKRRIDPTLATLNNIVSPTPNNRKRMVVPSRVAPQAQARILPPPPIKTETIFNPFDEAFFGEAKLENDFDFDRGRKPGPEDDFFSKNIESAPNATRTTSPAKLKRNKRKGKKEAATNSPSSFISKLLPSPRDRQSLSKLAPPRGHDQRSNRGRKNSKASSSPSKYAATSTYT